MSDIPAKSSPRGALDDLGPLYHEYAFFGVENAQLPGIYELNQKAKAPIITAYIAFATAKARQTVQDSVSFSELFCADGYYAMVAARLGCRPSLGIDSNRDGCLETAGRIASALGIDRVRFVTQEITAESRLDDADIIANVGGLYHVSEPEQILHLSYRHARKYLIVQNVVSLASNDDDYFESPAPGWTWGSRFSRASFDKLVRSMFPRIVDSHFNELEGNDRPEDRGSAYYLIEK